MAYWSITPRSRIFGFCDMLCPIPELVSESRCSLFSSFTTDCLCDHFGLGRIGCIKWKSRRKLANTIYDKSELVRELQRSWLNHIYKIRSGLYNRIDTVYAYRSWIWCSFFDKGRRSSPRDENGYLRFRIFRITFDKPMTWDHPTASHSLGML